MSSSGSRVPPRDVSSLLSSSSTVACFDLEVVARHCVVALTPAFFLDWDMDWEFAGLLLLLAVFFEAEMAIVVQL